MFLGLNEAETIFLGCLKISWTECVCAECPPPWAPDTFETNQKIFVVKAEPVRSEPCPKKKPGKRKTPGQRDRKKNQNRCGFEVKEHTGPYRKVSCKSYSMWLQNLRGSTRD